MDGAGGGLASAEDAADRPAAGSGEQDAGVVRTGPSGLHHLWTALRHGNAAHHPPPSPTTPWEGLWSFSIIQSALGGNIGNFAKNKFCLNFFIFPVVHVIKFVTPCLLLIFS